ncbi:MAG: hypothetical protein CMH70_00890 [Nitrosomonadaceae bacterium]|nr:hypothetical protein [Nitrosomonadaceae bacterium]|tara:strand:+ start:1154 stop:1699 length:546 start_codon:yes stop_codon:yes gene_type:complete
MIFDTKEQKIYHARHMSARIVIDAHDFVRFSRSLHGNITLDKCTRLKDYLANNRGDLKYEINGILNKNDQSILQVIVKGEINLLCQRCLSEFAYALNLKSDLLLVNNEEELSYLDEDESIEGILATSDMDIIELIEEEIILSLPISPRHKEDICPEKELINSYKLEKKQPFAKLSKLKNLQ